MGKSSMISLFILLLFLLSSCTYVVHRELTHKDFVVQYPNWKNYQLDKYEDETFKAITINKKNTCNVLVSAYTTGYLAVTQVILDTIEETPAYTIEEKKIKYNSAKLTYTNVAQETTEQVAISILQCGDYSYVVQYSCEEENYGKHERSRGVVFNSMQCTAPYTTNAY